LHQQFLNHFLMLTEISFELVAPHRQCRGSRCLIAALLQLCCSRCLCPIYFS
jgi:hypothetical protein